MKIENACRYSALAAAVAVLCGCAAQQAPQQRSDQRNRLQCPVGHTMTCEARSLGRIVHGSLARNTDRCACVPDDGPILQSPVIPSTRYK